MLLDELIEMPRIREAIHLAELPSPSTLCKAFNRLDTAVWRVLLNLSVTLLPTYGVVGIDASGFDRIRPLIKHRDFSSLHKAWNTWIDADLYGQRSQSGTVNSRLKRKYGAFVHSQCWWKQFRELAVGRLTHNIDKAL